MSDKIRFNVAEGRFLVSFTEEEASMLIAILDTSISDYKRSKKEYAEQHGRTLKSAEKLDYFDWWIEALGIIKSRIEKMWRQFRIEEEPR